MVNISWKAHAPLTTTRSAASQRVSPARMKSATAGFSCSVWVLADASVKWTAYFWECGGRWISTFRFCIFGLTKKCHTKNYIHAYNTQRVSRKTQRTHTTNRILTLDARRENTRQRHNMLAWPVEKHQKRRGLDLTHAKKPAFPKTAQNRLEGTPPLRLSRHPNLKDWACAS